MSFEYVNFQSFLSVTDFVTDFTMILERGWKVLGLHMVPHKIPPRVAELSTYSTGPLVCI